LNPDLDFRTRLAALSDVPEYKRANRSLRIIAEGTAVATGNARILGINFSGFVAWWLWRTIYLLKLPRFEKKLRVALD
jgi:NADH dehydrogenase FAD-containing subunit